MVFSSAYGSGRLRSATWLMRRSLRAWMHVVAMGVPERDAWRRRAATRLAAPGAFRPDVPAPATLRLCNARHDATVDPRTGPLKCQTPTRPLRTIDACRPLAAAAPLAAQEKPQPQPVDINSFESVKVGTDPQMAPSGSTVLYSVQRRALRRTAAPRPPSRSHPPAASPTAYPDAIDERRREARWSPDGKRVAYIAGGQLWVADADGRRAPAHASQRRRDGPRLGTQAIASRSPRLSIRAARRRLQCIAAESRRQQGESARHRPAHVPPLECVGRRNAIASLRRRSRRQRAATLHSARSTMCRPARSAAASVHWSPDGRRSPIRPRIRAATMRRRPISTSIRFRRRGDAQGHHADQQRRDQNPVYSPDGTLVRVPSQARAGFESDRWRLMIYQRANGRESCFRRGIATPTHSSGADIHASAIQTTDAARQVLSLGFANGVGRPRRRSCVGATTTRHSSLSCGSHDRVDAGRHGLPRRGVRATWAPARRGPRGHARERRARSRTLVNRAEDYWFTGANGEGAGHHSASTEVAQGKKFPAILLIHGGPQGRGSISGTADGTTRCSRRRARRGDHQSARLVGLWPEVRRRVSRDWGGKVYTDLMKGLDAALAKNPWIDGRRMGAAGGSFGGYMVDWIAGHSDRFKALVSHAGPFNLENMYGQRKSCGSRLGIRRRELGSEGDAAAVPQVVAASLREEFQDADARHRR